MHNRFCCLSSLVQSDFDYYHKVWSTYAAILPEDYPLREEMVACYTPLSLHNTVQQTRVHRPPQYTG